MQFVSHADVGFYAVEKFFQQIGCLPAGELSAEKIMRARNYRMKIMSFPMIYFLPFPVSFRNSKRKMKTRIYDFISGAGVHPITPLEGQGLKSFFERDIKNELPWADEFLKAPTAPPHKYWSVRGGRSNYKARYFWWRDSLVTKRK